MVFYKNINELSEKIKKIAKDDKTRRSIARKGKEKYMKYFNSTLVADYILRQTLGIKKNKKHLWEK